MTDTRPDGAASGAEPTEQAIAWLLSSSEPAVRRMLRRDLLDEDVGGTPDDDVLDGPWVQALLSGQHDDGGFGNQPYRKWTGTHWRLLSLVELEVPATQAVQAALERELSWLVRAHRRVRMLDGRARVCASIPGAGVAVACRLGRSADKRVHELVEGLLQWQWPDGGWNCDRQASGRRSSFHETLLPTWGLHEYAKAAGDAGAREAGERGAELLLAHRLFRKGGTGEPIDNRWVVPRYPPYWHYDILHALIVLTRMGKATDARAADALAELRKQRRPDGCWSAGAAWWRGVGTPTAPEVVDWGRTGPNVMVTLNALRALRAGGGGSDEDQ